MEGSLSPYYLTNNSYYSKCVCFEVDIFHHPTQLMTTNTEKEFKFVEQLSTTMQFLTLKIQSYALAERGA